MSTDDKHQKWKKKELWLLAAPFLVLVLIFGISRLPGSTRNLPSRVNSIASPLQWKFDYKVRGGDLMADYGRFAIIFKGFVKPPTKYTGTRIRGNADSSHLT